MNPVAVVIVIAHCLVTVKPDADGGDELVGDSGVATILIHEGNEYKKQGTTNGSLTDPASITMLNPNAFCSRQVRAHGSQLQGCEREGQHTILSSQ